MNTLRKLRKGWFGGESDNPLGYLMARSARLLRQDELPAGTEELRSEMRAFLAEEIARGSFEPRCDAWLGGFDPEFSRKLGERGWLGMTWPGHYGGGERSALERFVAQEELLAAGAPVTAHWIADRQAGPSLLRFGTEEQKEHFLPSIVRGECFFSIGMSEPGSGSDLASVETIAEREDGGWRVSGTKLWTGGAHRAHYFFVLCRTSPLGEDRHAGLSQLIVDLSTTGVEILPIRLLSGEHVFNEVRLQDVWVPDEMVLGEIGDGWKQVTSELALERSGPERFLSTFPLFAELVRRVGPEPDRLERNEMGALFSKLWTLRRMSLSVTAALDSGESPDVEAALVKDMGTRFESEVVEEARRLLPCEPSPDSQDNFERYVAESVLHSPGYTLRGGTSEILRSIVARGLGVR